VTRATLVISGLVQGVFYRASAQKEASRLGLVGEIRNLPGGNVEAIAEGEKAAIEEFATWCRRGPPAARVHDVEISWAEPTGEFRAFRVTR
jgi:acylphosphatase